MRRTTRATCCGRRSRGCWASRSPWGSATSSPSRPRPIVRREHRIWEQVQVQQRVGGWTLSHRGRLEQRWLHLAPSVVVRTRYQFRAAHPIAQSRAGRGWCSTKCSTRCAAPPWASPGLRPASARRRHLPRAVGSRHRRRRLHVAVPQPPRPSRPARPLRRLRPLRALLTGVGPWPGSIAAPQRLHRQARLLRSAKCRLLADLSSRA